MWANRGRGVSGLPGDAVVSESAGSTSISTGSSSSPTARSCRGENRAFAPPDEAHLRRYAEVEVKRISNSARLVLLSITDPGWPGVGMADLAGGPLIY